MRAIRRILLIFFGGVLLLAALVGGGGYLWMRGSLPRTEGEIRIDALEAPVAVRRNADGLVRIQAANELDLYRALGFVHAQERLWQMDFMRRTASGRLSEIMGKSTLSLDRFFRTLGFRQLVEENLANLSPETQAALEAYAEGVNAYLKSHSGPLPPEFQILRYQPEPWRPADSLLWGRLMALRLSSNWRDELSRTRLAGRFSPDRIAELWPHYPKDAPITLAQMSTLIDRSVATQLAHLLPPSLAPTGASNAWVLDGKRTATGSPILANDPHLSLDAPGPWFLVRLEAPGLTLAGATAPGVPFLVLGHNEHVAWGMTTTHSDTQDFFIERISPDNPNQYETPEGPENFTTRDEFIRLSGGESVRLIVRGTRHGPVMSDVIPDGSSDTGAVLALSWPALRNDDRTADALYGMNHAQSVEAFRQALRQFHSPQQNIFYADTTGHTGFMAPARVPVRRAGNGQHPVPGWSGEFDWIGFVPFEELPSSEDPRSGLIVNANNQIVPDNFPHLIAVDWPPPYRAERINTVLAGAAGTHSVADSVILQQDIVATAADQILPSLLAAAPTDDRARKAVALLRTWDRKMHRNAPEPLIFQAWIWALGRAILQDDLGPNYLDFLDGSTYTLQRLIADNSSWCDDSKTPETEDCNAQIKRSLGIALDYLTKRFGSDMSSWRWGDAHVARFPHPLFSRIPVLRDLLDFAVRTDGADDTVNRASARLGGSPDHLFEDVHGAGLRAVYDLSNLDRSRFMIATGQSGNPLSRFYGNFMRRWRNGQTVSLAPESWAVAEQLSLLPSQK